MVKCGRKVMWNVNTEIVCSIVAAAGVAVSALVSWFAARYSAEKEIKKMKMSWSREDSLSSSEEFADMCGAVAAYARCLYKDNQIEAARQIAKVRAKESGELARQLDDLYNAVKNSIPNLTDETLSHVIDEYRKSRRN